MTYAINYRLDKQMPKLGWLSIVNFEKQIIEIIHGNCVECNDHWMVEGVWDGEFKNGNFHKTNVFFGSGVRIDNEKVIFVPPSTLTDRIMFCQDRDNLIFSNSLLLLLAFTDSRLVDEHDYHNESLSITKKGIKHYNREFAISHPYIRHFNQIFYENIVINNGNIQYVKKTKDHKKITSFEMYDRLINEKLKRLKENYESLDRKTPVRAYTTLSAGYDSTAVSCLAKRIGVKECFTAKRLSHLPFLEKEEGGEKIARILGLKAHKLLYSKRDVTTEERYFLSGGNYPKNSKSVWSEISFHPIVKKLSLAHGTVSALFTGYRGDSLWGADIDTKYWTDEMKGHGAISGLNLTEVRLRAGLIVLAIPYIYARNQRSMIKISQSREMDNWRLRNTYDRPIARRIVEESGIDRHMFGTKKKHITTTYILPINKKNRKAFLKDIKIRKNIGRFDVFYAHIEKYLHFLGYLIQENITKKRKIYERRIDFYDLMRKWAANSISEEISSIFANYKS